MGGRIVGERGRVPFKVTSDVPGLGVFPTRDFPRARVGVGVWRFIER